MERVMPETKPNHRSPGAFTLVKLPAVVAIVAILAALVIPAFGMLSDANRISNSALLVAGQFDLARQTALAENRLVEVRVYAIPTDNNTGTVEWRGIQIFGADGAALDRLQLLPEGTAMDLDPAFSKLLSLANTITGTVEVPGHALRRQWLHVFACFGTRFNK